VKRGQRGGRPATNETQRLGEKFRETSELSIPYSSVGGFDILDGIGGAAGLAAADRNFNGGTFIAYNKG
jgi:hypothetical protein